MKFSQEGEIQWNTKGWPDAPSSETGASTVKYSTKQTWDASHSNQHFVDSDSAIKDSLGYLEQWGGLAGFMNAFMINPSRADAVYQAGKLILVLRAQGASFANPRKQPWDEEIAQLEADLMFKWRCEL